MVRVTTHGVLCAVLQDALALRQRQVVEYYGSQ